MFDKLLAKMQKRVVNDSAPNESTAQSSYSQRKYTRRDCDTCVSKINGQNFPVIDWSIGGVQVAADTRLFSIDDIVDITLKFKLSDSVVSIPHRARVVRKTNEHLGLQFRPLTQGMREDLQHVVEDYARTRSA